MLEGIPSPITPASHEISPALPNETKKLEGQAPIEEQASIEEQSPIEGQAVVKLTKKLNYAYTKEVPGGDLYKINTEISPRIENEAFEKMKEDCETWLSTIALEEVLHPGLEVEGYRLSLSCSLDGQSFALNVYNDYGDNKNEEILQKLLIQNGLLEEGAVLDPRQEKEMIDNLVERLDVMKEENLHVDLDTRKRNEKSMALLKVIPALYYAKLERTYMKKNEEPDLKIEISVMSKSLVQILVKKMGLVPGSCIAQRSTNLMISMGSWYLGKKEFTATHLAIMLECSRDKVRIIEVEPNKGGAVREMDIDEFKNFITTGRHKLGFDIYTEPSGQAPSPEALAYLRQLSENVRIHHISYNYLNLIIAPIRDGRIGDEVSVRMALHTVRNGMPSTPDGQRNLSLICSDFAAHTIQSLEIIREEVRENVVADAERMAYWQNNHKVTKRNPLLTTPAALAEDLIDRGYVSTRINENKYNDALKKSKLEVNEASKLRLQAKNNMMKV